MNAAHLHLMINHVPLFFLLFGSVFMIWYIFTKRNELLIAAMVVCVAGSIGAVIASQSGEKAEEIVEHVPDVTEGAIHEHEEAAEFGQVLALVVAALSVATYLANRFKPALGKPVLLVTLLGSVLGLISMARISYLGGQIRHIELRDDFTIQKDFNTDLHEEEEMDDMEYEANGDALGEPVQNENLPGDEINPTEKDIPAEAQEGAKDPN